MIRFLSKKLRAPQSNILIVKGLKDRFKILEIHGLTLEKTVCILDKYLKGE